jgi:DNA uptake protein ComE-like DNA-binding protein
MFHSKNIDDRYQAPTSIGSKPLQLSGMVLILTFSLFGCGSEPETSSTSSSPLNQNSNSVTKPIATTSKIDINSASIAELDKLELPGTKPSLSERIQGKRPYKTADDLVSKKAISVDEYKLIKDLIIVGKGK